MDSLHRRACAADLMGRIRDGDEQALSELMHMFASELGGVAFALLERRDLALEAVQDVFVSLWEQRKALSNYTNIPGYLARAVRNRALNKLKAERRYHRLLDTVAEEQYWRGEGSGAADLHMEEAEAMRILWQRIQQIPESPRRVLLLHWYARKSYEEISDLLEVKLKTVRQLMYRATTKLAELSRNE